MAGTVQSVYRLRYVLDVRDGQDCSFGIVTSVQADVWEIMVPSHHG